MLRPVPSMAESGLPGTPDDGDGAVGVARPVERPALDDALAPILRAEHSLLPSGSPIPTIMTFHISDDSHLR
jgi:hypothetical protein